MRTFPTVLAIVPAAILLALVVGGARAQEEEGSTPGAIPDPGSYQGSQQLQQQSDRQDQQFRQQQQQADQPTYNQPSYTSPGPAYNPAPRPSRPSSSRVPAPRGASPPAAQGALVEFQVGALGPGAFTPLAGVHLWVTAEDPVRALTVAGIQPIGSSLAQLTYDCQVAWVCVRDFKLMTAKAVGVYTTNASGRARTGTIPPGRYFVVGYGAFKGGTMVWSGPVHVQGGVNTVAIDQKDGSAVAVARGR